MATGSGNGTFYSAQAAETLASAQYKVGKLNSTGYLAIAASATTGLGIIQNDAASGEVGLIQLSGISKAVAAASVTVGAKLASNTTGQVAVTTSANDNVIGRALTASTNAGEIITIMIGGASNL
jgi:hypothetical protein